MTLWTFVNSLHAITTLFHGTLDNFWRSLLLVPQIDFCFRSFRLKTTSSQVVLNIIESSEVTWQSNREFPGPFSTEMIDGVFGFPYFLFHYFLFIMNIQFIMNFIKNLNFYSDAILIVIIGRWLGPTYLLCRLLLKLLLFYVEYALEPKKFRTWRRTC